MLTSMPMRSRGPVLALLGHALKCSLSLAPVHREVRTRVETEGVSLELPPAMLPNPHFSEQQVDLCQIDGPPYAGGCVIFGACPDNSKWKALGQRCVLIL